MAGNEMRSMSLRYKSLDGLRAVSILLVMIAHSRGGIGASWARSVTNLDIGNLGVRIFFVISGFLITNLLLSELSQTRTISIRNFYIRRFFRIFPAFSAYLGVLLALAMFHLIHLPLMTILRSALYLGDYPFLTAGLPSPYKTWFTVHTWSLAVEEQFYLMWPLLLLILRPKAAIKAILVCILVQPFLRLATFELFHSYRPFLAISFEMVCDALATGCLLALVCTSLHAWEPYNRLQRSRFAVPLSISLFWLAYRVKSTHELLWLLAGIPLANFSAAFLLDHCMTAENIYTKGLNLGWVVHIGVLSYSLYLWQEVFLVQGRWNYQPWHWFPISWVLAFGAASGSYYLVERPFLRLRERLRILRPKKGTPTSHIPLRPLPAGLDRFAS